VAAWTLQVENTLRIGGKTLSGKNKKPTISRSWAQEKSSGSIAYKSNVTHSREPTCAQVQRQQQQALLLLATAMRTEADMSPILTVFLNAGK
jgi:hypothetical protein